ARRVVLGGIFTAGARPAVARHALLVALPGGGLGEDRRRRERRRHGLLVGRDAGRARRTEAGVAVGARGEREVVRERDEVRAEAIVGVVAGVAALGRDRAHVRRLLVV